MYNTAASPTAEFHKRIWSNLALSKMVFASEAFGYSLTAGQMPMDSASLSGERNSQAVRSAPRPEPRTSSLYRLDQEVFSTPNLFLGPSKG